jgi:hypothetical protein
VARIGVSQLSGQRGELVSLSNRNKCLGATRSLELPPRPFHWHETPRSELDTRTTIPLTTVAGKGLETGPGTSHGDEGPADAARHDHLALRQYPLPIYRTIIETNHLFRPSRGGKFEPCTGNKRTDILYY